MYNYFYYLNFNSYGYDGQGIVYNSIREWFNSLLKKSRLFLIKKLEYILIVLSVLFNRKTCKSLIAPKRNKGWKGGRE